MEKRPSSAHALDVEVVTLLQKTVVGKSVEADDLVRWFSQGFCFSAEEPTYGLTQSHGGPCGVISAVQAEIFRNVLFTDGTEDTDMEALPLRSPEQCQDIFECAAWAILRRSSTDDTVYLMDPGNRVLSQFSDCTHLTAIHCRDEESFKQYLRQLMPVYSGQAGCFLYLISIVMTRGAQRIREEMDDLENTLIGNFGHCTQELLNLLLMGQATSNVFDGSMPLGGSGDSTTDGDNKDDDSLMLRGIPSRATVGYLTQLEALRYCQVGSYYKIPVFPIWVVGSSSHFTVLFSADRRVNEESDDEALLTKVQRAFKSIDTDECGFIMEDRLAEVLRILEIEQVEDTTWLTRLSNHLQMEGGGGIILWSQFWETTSMLLTGQSLDEIMCYNSGSERRDSDVARGLQQLDDVTDGSRMRSDSDLARQLQDEWNADDIPSLENDDSNQRCSPTRKVTRHRTDSLAGKDADIFILYHYNGFSGLMPSSSANAKKGIAHRKLTRLTLFRRSQETSVGQSIAFSSGAGSAFAAGNAMTPIEEVLRTRWPGCRLEWLGSEPRLD